MREVVTALAGKLESGYVLEDTGKRMKEALVTNLAKKAYTELPTDAELAQRLTAELRAIAHDRHLAVYQPGGMPDLSELNPQSSSICPTGSSP